MKRAELAERGRLTLDSNELWRQVGQHQHLLQLYGHDKSLLRKNVGRYLSQALLPGDAAVVIASASHKRDFCHELARLEVDVSAAERQQRLFLFDAAEMLDRIVVDGSPDAARFEQHVAQAIRQARAAARNGVVRAYGEMVGLLWQARQLAASIRLEHIWNDLRQNMAFELFCAYPIDVFDKQFELGVVGALLAAHTQLLPSAAGAHLTSALQRAMDDLLILGEKDERSRIQLSGRFAGAAMPGNEAAILWLRRHHPDRADAVLSRARRYL